VVVVVVVRVIAGRPVVVCSVLTVVVPITRVVTVCVVAVLVVVDSVVDDERAEFQIVNSQMPEN